MNELTEILGNATSAIEASYFRLNIDGGNSVYRERVYCYELYHQMRLRWPADCEFYLNGELDKMAHPILKKLRAAHAKPDLLVHRPGHMSWNHAIIEVKKAKAPNDGIRKDIHTLDLFLRSVGYRRAIYLFFGYEANDRLVERVQTIAAEFSELVPIEIWLHQKIGQPATHNTTLQRSANICASVMN